MIKKLKEANLLDFEMIFLSAVIIIGVIFLIINKLDFSVRDIYAETIPKSTITSTNTLGEIQGTIDNTVMFSSGGLIDTRYGIGVRPIYTTDQMVNYIMRKGNELISIFQVLAQPFCIIVFILGCGKALIEGLKGTAGSGLITMIASAIFYTLILYASNVINSLPNFIAN